MSGEDIHYMQAWPLASPHHRCSPRHRLGGRRCSKWQAVVPCASSPQTAFYPAHASISTLTEQRKILNYQPSWTEDLSHSKVIFRDVDPAGVGLHVIETKAGSVASLSINNRARDHKIDDGHVMTLLRGQASLELTGMQPLTLDASIHPVHVYVPPKHTPMKWTFHGRESGCKMMHVFGKANGEHLDIRNEKYAQASGRFVLTQQYVSRRIFCHGDKTILTKNGDSISWFRTTMFCTKGLPLCMDDQGGRAERLQAGRPDPLQDRPTFRMSYDYTTEINMCYEVDGRAEVRFAKHPYDDVHAWTQWHKLDAQACYHLNEARDGPEVEHRIERGRSVPKRNRHEVFIEDGSVSLMCLFDPGCTGRETHHVGEYSSYQPQEIYETEAYAQALAEEKPVLDMVVQLSLRDAVHNNTHSFAPTGDLQELFAVYARKLEEQQACHQAALEGAPSSRRDVMRRFALREDCARCCRISVQGPGAG